MSMNIRNGIYTDAAAISEIHSLCWREVYSFMPEEVHQARSKQYRKEQWDNWFKRSPEDEMLLVLTSDDVVVGFALSKPNHDTEINAKGEMHAGYVLPEFRGGVSGPALMRELAERMFNQGQWPACIWAFQENPYRRFYSALGWHASVFRTRSIAGNEIPEVGYTSPSFLDLATRLDRMLALTAQSQTQSLSQRTFHHNRQAS